MNTIEYQVGPPLATRAMALGVGRNSPHCRSL
jgi:hypothetical protein